MVRIGLLGCGFVATFYMQGVGMQGVGSDSRLL